MGEQFFWFYDLLILVIFAGITFRCFKRGFVSSVVGLAATAAALIVGLLLSGLIAPIVYDNLIRNRAGDYIDERLTEMVDEQALAGLSNIDPARIMINGQPLSAIPQTPDSVGKLEVDLSNVDLSNTGIENLNLSVFGIDPEDLKSVNAGKAVITSSELAGNDFETLVLAKTLAFTIQNGEDYAAVRDVAEAVSQYVPQIAGSFSGNVNDSISAVIIAIYDSEGDSVSDALLDNLLAPIVMVPLRTLIFFILFIIISIILSVIARSLSVVNRIPVVGTVNSVLGIAVGVLKSAVIVLLICAGVNILVAVTGNNIIFLNTMTIDETFAFRHIYYLNFINF